jgi:hypothetical protein
VLRGVPLIGAPPQTINLLISVLRQRLEEIAHGAIQLPADSQSEPRRVFEAGRYAGVKLALEEIEGLLASEGEDIHGS